MCTIQLNEVLKKCRLEIKSKVNIIDAIRSLLMMRRRPIEDV